MRLCCALLAVVAIGCSHGLPHPPYVAQPASALVQVTYPPPPPRVETVPPQPNPTAVWIDGEWAWRLNKWAWKPGRWVDAPPGLAYSPWTSGHRDDGAFFYAPGTWRDARGTEAAAPKPLALATVSEAAVINSHGAIENTGASVTDDEDTDSLDAGVGRPRLGGDA